MSEKKRNHLAPEVINLDTRHFCSELDSGAPMQIAKIVADDGLFRMDSELTTDESHLLHIAITRNADDYLGGRLLPIRREVKIDAKFYAELLGIDCDNAYMRLRNAAETLYQRELHYPKTETTPAIRFRWVTSIGGFDEKPVNYANGTISFRLSEELCSYLENLDPRPGRKSYTTILHKSIKNLKPRSTAILKYLASHIDHRKIKEEPGRVVMTLDEIRRITHTENKMRTFGNLNNKVIKPALEDINFNSDYEVAYVLIKKGKKVVSISFSITLAKQLRLI